MQERLERIHVENFKSLKDFEIKLGKFNVIIGPNGSGKTNVLELFKFINLCINPQGTPSYPFTPWWGFNNIVWFGKEDLPITVDLQYSMLDSEMRYSAVISGSGGKFSFLYESFLVDDFLKISRDASSIEYQYDKKFLDKNKETILKLSRQSNEDTEELFSPRSHKISTSESILRYRSAGWTSSYPQNMDLYLGRFDVFEDHQCIDAIPFVSPVIKKDNKNIPLFPRVIDFLTCHNPIIFLRRLDLNLIHQPSSIGKNDTVSEDGDGMVSLLFQWHTQNGGKLPDRITFALEELFPNWQVTFKITDDGRVMLGVKDGELALSPTSIPDGFYKLLAILTAVELDPKILLIDEVDASLHGEIIDYLISTFKTSAPTVIVTTHSPLVIDMVDLEDLILLERQWYETKSHRIQNPQKMMKQLAEKGITASESWLYAKL